MIDYYKTLGVNKNATADEIKHAYRKLAHQYHPDKKGGNESKFKEINEAYQILSDPQKRSNYDQFGSGYSQNFSGFNQGGFDGFDFSNFGFNQGANFNFNDIFEMFGGFGGRKSERNELNKGDDIIVNIDIDFYLSIRGGNKNIEIYKENICLNCSGSGIKQGSSTETCSNCKGTGEIKENTRSIFGTIVRVQTCKKCAGSGKIPKDKCEYCKGDGKILNKKSIDITIPPGIKNGETLVVRNLGNAGFRNGPAGDLFLKIRVLPDNRFQRIGNDLYYKLTIKLTDAILGKKALIPTLDGEKEIEIPSGVEDGEEIRIKGLGVYGRHRGDEVIKIKIAIPKKVSRKARELAEELSKEI